MYKFLILLCILSSSNVCAMKLAERAWLQLQIKMIRRRERSTKQEEDRLNKKWARAVVAACLPDSPEEKKEAEVYLKDLYPQKFEEIREAKNRDTKELSDVYSFLTFPL